VTRDDGTPIDGDEDEPCDMGMLHTRAAELAIAQARRSRSLRLAS
jgi:hypothetical protein